MFKIADRVKEVSITAGNGQYIALYETLPGFQSFANAIGDGNTTYYTIENGANFEIGLGTYIAATNSISRDEIYTSSNSNQRINLVGSSIVFCSYPANKVFLLDSQGFATGPDGSYVGINLPDGTVIISDRKQIKTCTQNTTILVTDDVVLTDCSFNNITLTLPLAADATGKEIVIKLKNKTDNNKVTIVPQGSNLVDSTASIALEYKNSSITLVSDSLNWYII